MDILESKGFEINMGLLMRAYYTLSYWVAKLRKCDKDHKHIIASVFVTQKYYLFISLFCWTIILNCFIQVPSFKNAI